MSVTTETKPDFVGLKRAYETRLTNGQRADIRRAPNFEELSLVPAVYRLVPPGTAGGPQFDRWLRVIHFLPLTEGHNPDAPTLGAMLARRGISETRMMQVARSEPPNDLRYLRQLVSQLDHPVVNWEKLGALLFFWNEQNRRRLIEDFYANYDFSES